MRTFSSRRARSSESPSTHTSSSAQPASARIEGASRLASAGGGVVPRLRPLSRIGDVPWQRSRAARDSHWHLSGRCDRGDQAVCAAAAARRAGPTTWPWTAACKGSVVAGGIAVPPAGCCPAVRAGARAVACLLPWVDFASTGPVCAGRHRRRSAFSRLSVRPHPSGQNVLAGRRPVDAAVRQRPPGAVHFDAVADRPRVRPPRGRHQLPARISLRTGRRHHLGSGPPSLRDSGYGEDVVFRTEPNRSRSSGWRRVRWSRCWSSL